MITAVTTCMGRKEHLEVTLPLMLEEFERVIVVDWSCPQNVGDWAEAEGADVVRKPNHPFFSVSKARNAGARAVTTRSVCFIDADTMVMPGLRAEIESKLDLSHMVVASRNAQNYDIHDLGGFIAVDIGHFWGIRGYNELLLGYALEDCFLRAQLCLERGLKVRRVSPGMLGAMRHSNELRGRHHEEPIEVSSRRNYAVMTKYLQLHGVEDWFTDPKTADIAYRIP